MSSSHTLNSRLRLLIARAYRAEKVYAATSAKQSEQRLNSSQLTEGASELRAREWHKSHNRLRIALNDLLTNSSASSLAQAVNKVRLEFVAQVSAATKVIEQDTEELHKALQRTEFTMALRLSVELIKHKAVLQSGQAIAEELEALLKSSGFIKVQSLNARLLESLEREEKKHKARGVGDGRDGRMKEVVNYREANRVNSHAVNNHADNVGASSVNANSVGVGNVSVVHNNVVQFRRRVI